MVRWRERIFRTCVPVDPKTQFTHDTLLRDLEAICAHNLVTRIFKLLTLYQRLRVLYSKTSIRIYIRTPLCKLKERGGRGNGKWEM